MDKGEGGGRQKWIKNIVNIINIDFAIVDKGLVGRRGKTLIPFCG